MLEERRRVVEAQVFQKILTFRETEHVGAIGPLAGSSDDPALDDIDFALVQMQAETLDKIHRAIDRLASGEYGICDGCQKEIPANRLRAVPFATQCRACQEITDEARSRATQSAPAYSVWL